MKNAEIRLAKYAKSYFVHPQVLPFLELIYETDSAGTNKNLNTFLSNVSCNRFFLGIPHKNTALVKKDTMYVSKVNSTKESYFQATMKLFNIKEAIPVFYIYDAVDASYLTAFIKKGRARNRSIGIIVSTSSSKFIDLETLTENDFVFVDINTDTLSSKRVVLNTILTNCVANIILLRENRRIDLMNNVIETGKPAPFENDLSREIEEKNDELSFKIFGFADYCGSKNSIATTGGGGNRNKMYPAWAMYSRKLTTPEFIGAKSTKSLDEQMASFNELKHISIAQMNLEPNIEKTTSIEMLNNEKVGTFAFWNVLTQWHYLSQMVIYDAWKDICQERLKQN